MTESKSHTTQSVDTAKIAIIGLGYVGLPLAVEFGKQFDTLGFDINASRVDELRRGYDHTREVSAEELEESVKLRFTTDIDGLRDRTTCIVSVPTPVDAHKRPDFTPLINASQVVGGALKRGWATW